MFAFLWSIPGIHFVRKEEIDALKGLYSDLITDVDDAPHIHAYFAHECDYFVTTDRRLTEMKIREKVDFRTPKSFLHVLGVEGYDTLGGVLSFMKFLMLQNQPTTPDPQPHNRGT